MIPKLKSSLFHKCPRCLEGNLYVTPNPYVLKETSNMHAECPKCGLNFMPEPGYYYGAMYVSYALTIAVGVSIFVAENVLFGSFNAIGYLIALTIILLALAPYTFRTSRAIWLNMFFKYDPTLRAKILEKQSLSAK
jgi:uncharacterized protein (DUF983 family)